MTGDNYYQQFRVEDPGGADIASSNMTMVTATAQNMSFGTFYYNTPTVSEFIACLPISMILTSYKLLVTMSACNMSSMMMAMELPMSKTCVLILHLAR